MANKIKPKQMFTLVAWNGKRIIIEHVLVDDAVDAERFSEETRKCLRHRNDDHRWQVMRGWLQVEAPK